MSATNQTPNEHLSQFISSDKPSWLGDYNGDMTKIDAAFASMQAAINLLTTQLNAANATITANAATITTLTNRINIASTRIVAIDHGTAF